MHNLKEKNLYPLRQLYYTIVEGTSREVYRFYYYISGGTITVFLRTNNVTYRLCEKTTETFSFDSTTLSRFIDARFPPETPDTHWGSSVSLLLFLEFDVGVNYSRRLVSSLELLGFGIFSDVEVACEDIGRKLVSCVHWVQSKRMDDLVTLFTHNKNSRLKHD